MRLPSPWGEGRRFLPAYFTEPSEKTKTSSAITILLAVALSTGCRSLLPQAPFDLSQPGWKVFQGQAVWRPKAGGSEIAGELLVAVNADGRGLAQFTKTPLPLVLAQLDTRQWQIEFPADHRQYSGRGEPPRPLLWLVLLKSLNDPQLAPALIQANGRLQITDAGTGEKIEGYLAPDSRFVQP